MRTGSIKDELNDIATWAQHQAAEAYADYAADVEHYRERGQLWEGLLDAVMALILRLDDFEKEAGAPRAGPKEVPQDEPSPPVPSGHDE